MANNDASLWAAIRAAEAAGEWSRAEALLTAAARSSDPFWRVSLADLLCRRGRLNEALALVDAVLRDRPGDAGALRVKGVALWRLRRFVAADECLVAAWMAGSAPYAAYLVARVRRHTAGDAGALEWVERVLRTLPGDGRLLRERATLLQRLGRSGESVEAARRALEASPENGEALAGWIGARVAALPAQQAAQEIRHLLRLPRLAGEPRLHALLGRTLERAGLPVEALQAWRRAATVAPQAPGHRCTVLFALRRCGQRQEAFDGLAALVRTDPTHIPALAALVADARALGRQAEVRRLLHGLIRADPGRSHLWGWLRRLARPPDAPARRKGMPEPKGAL